MFDGSLEPSGEGYTVSLLYMSVVLIVGDKDEHETRGALQRLMYHNTTLIQVLNVCSAVIVRDQGAQSYLILRMYGAVSILNRRPEVKGAKMLRLSRVETRLNSQESLSCTYSP